MNEHHEFFEELSRLSRMLRRSSHGGGQSHMFHGGRRILRIVLDHEGMRATELANETDLRPSSITDVLKRLEEEGYIEKRKDEADSRAAKIYSTDKAREQQREWEATAQTQSEQLLACLTDEEITSFCAICRKLNAHLENQDKRHRDPNMPHHAHHHKGKGCHHHGGQNPHDKNRSERDI